LESTSHSCREKFPLVKKKKKLGLQGQTAPATLC
jgi:hypothetical protein